MLVVVLVLLKLGLTILFKIITRIELLFANYLGRYSYSFRARQELISVTVTVCESDGNMSLQLQFGRVTFKNGHRTYFRKLQLQLHKDMVFELNM